MTLADRKKLRQLANIESFESVTALLEHACHDSVVPAICTNDGCDYTDGMEPDQDKGWCEECDAGTMKSALVLAGVI